MLLPGQKYTLTSSFTLFLVYVGIIICVQPNDFKGVFAKETGASIVPMVHYIKDCTNSISDNPIHTVIDDPIKIDDLSERAGLEYVREILAYWFYLMMETYGKSTRERK